MLTKFDHGPNPRSAEKSSSGARHSWTTSESRLRVFGISNVIEYSASFIGKIEEDSAGAAFRPSVQENKSKNQPTTKL
ncbi:hypothetical protein ACHMXB_20815 [Arthrobacter sp. UC242_113]|uniref:hypothetical protein n=1 Tax=Arthrobacter sp. UC242_113 TaxID=3374550 RepID=UPI003757459D